MAAGYLACSFDLLNVADLDLIVQSRQRCSWLTVGVYSDEQVVRLNGRPPIVPLAERMALVEHIRGVDAVVVHENSRKPQSSDELIFAIAAQPDEPALGLANQLAVRRSTRSREILDALSPQEQSGVA